MSASILFGQSNGKAEQLFEKGMNALKGTGVSHNPTSAIDLLRQSADLGYAPAQVALGYFSDVGVVVVSDQGQAAQWYRRAADQNDRLAEWLLGRLYYASSAVPRDVDGAAKSFKRAADQGDAFGEYLLGEIELGKTQLYERCSTPEEGVGAGASASPMAIREASEGRTRHKARQIRSVRVVADQLRCGSHRGLE